jgi:CheY-like chemotaxis protein
VHINVVKKWIGEGLLNAYRLPAGHYRVEKEEYLRFLVATGMPLPNELRGEGSTAGRRRVLIVDDDHERLELVEKFIESLGYATGLALDGHLGLIQIGAFKPDLILLDIKMPNANGFDLLETLKTQETIPQIIVMTGERGPQLTDRLATFDIRDILYKPFTLASLRQAMAFLPAESH